MKIKLYFLSSPRRGKKNNCKFLTWHCASLNEINFIHCTYGPGKMHLRHKKALVSVETSGSAGRVLEV